MKVRITFELDDTERRAIAARVGDFQPAAYEDIKQWIIGTVRADLSYLVSDFLDQMETLKTSKKD